MKRTKIFFILLLLCAEQAFPQSEGGKTKLETLFTFGISVQSFTDIFFIDRKYQRIESSIPGGGGNAGGLGLPLSVKIYSLSRNVGISFESVVRYDVVTPRALFIQHSESKMFADHHFSIYRKFRFSRKEKERKKYMGVGYSFISPGLSYKADWITINWNTGKVTNGSKVDLSFDGFHFLYGMKVYKRFRAEGKLMYIPPYRIVYMYDEAALMFFLKATYQIEIKKKN